LDDIQEHAQRLKTWSCNNMVTYITTHIIYYNIVSVVSVLVFS